MPCAGRSIRSTRPGALHEACDARAVADCAGRRRRVAGRRSRSATAMGDLLQLVVSGTATGAIYALAALGFTLLWQAAGTINFAQGEFVMVPAFGMLACIALG